MADSNGGALIIGIGGKPKGDMGAMGAGKPGEVCVPIASLSTNDGTDDGSGNGNVAPEVGDIVNPDMRVTRIENGNAYLEAVGSTDQNDQADQNEAEAPNPEEDLLNKAKQVDQSGSY